MKASPAGIEPTLRDPQSRGLSVSLRGHHVYSNTSEAILKLNNIHSLLFDEQLYEDFQGENSFAKLLPIYQKRWFLGSHEMGETLQLLFLFLPPAFHLKQA